MKKYLSLMIVLSFVLVGDSVLAQRQGTDAKANAPVNTRSPSLTPEERKAFEEKRQRALEMDMKLKTRPDIELKKEDEMVRPARMQPLLELRLKERQEKIKELKETTPGTQKEKVAKVRDFIVTGMLQRAKNLAQIALKIKARIEKLEDGGVDVSVSLDLVLKAEESIASAKDYLAKAKASIDAGARVEEVRTHVEAAKAKLKEAHGYLTQAIRELKPRVEVNTEASVEATTQ